MSPSCEPRTHASRFEGRQVRRHEMSLQETDRTGMPTRAPYERRGRFGRAAVTAWSRGKPVGVRLASKSTNQSIFARRGEKVSRQDRPDIPSRGGRCHSSGTDLASRCALMAGANRVQQDAHLRGRKLRGIGTDPRLCFPLPQAAAGRKEEQTQLRHSRSPPTSASPHPPWECGNGRPVQPGNPGLPARRCSPRSVPWAPPPESPHR